MMVKALGYRYAADLFVQVVKLAREMGLVKLGTVAIDHTKIKVNASRQKAINMRAHATDRRRVEAQIEAPLERARTTYAAEASEPDLDIPAEIEWR